MKKLLWKISQESANFSMNERLINLLQQNRADKVEGKRKRKKVTIRYSFHWKNTSGRAAARSIAAMQEFGRIIAWWERRKKMTVLPAKLARSPGNNWRTNVEIVFNAIYTMNISNQSAMAREIFPQMMIFFVEFVLDYI